MAKILRSINIDQNIWESFQLLNPRKSSSMIEDYMRSCVNSFGVVSDAELLKLKEELECKSRSLVSLQDDIRFLKARIDVKEEQVRKEQVEKHKAEQERLSKAEVMSDAVRASGILEEIDVGF